MLKVMAPRPNSHTPGALEVSGLAPQADWRDMDDCVMVSSPGVEVVERCGQERVTASSEELRVQVWAANLTEQVAPGRQ